MDIPEQPNMTPEEFGKLKAEVARLGRLVAEMDPTCSFEGMEEGELRHMIENLRPDREMYAGKNFLLGILNSRGVGGLDKTTNKLSKALSENGELDIPHDFDVVEKEIFKKTALRLWHRKEFLTTIAWSIPGAILALKTPLDIHAVATDNEPSNPDDPHATVHKTHNVMKFLSLASEIPLAAALVYEGIRHDREMRLEHIADAVSELTDRIKQEQQRKGR